MTCGHAATAAVGTRGAGRRGHADTNIHNARWTHDTGRTTSVLIFYRWLTEWLASAAAVGLSAAIRRRCSLSLTPSLSLAHSRRPLSASSRYNRRARHDTTGAAERPVPFYTRHRTYALPPPLARSYLSPPLARSYPPLPRARSYPPPSTRRPNSIAESLPLGGVRTERVRPRRRRLPAPLPARHACRTNIVFLRALRIILLFIFFFHHNILFFFSTS